MSSEYYDQYEGANRSVIAKEARDKERRELKAEAMRNNVAKGLANALKNERIRQSIAKDALAATERGRHGMIDPRLQKVSSVGGALHRPYDDPEDIITGMEERPWESDPFDPWSE